MRICSVWFRGGLIQLNRSHINLPLTSPRPLDLLLSAKEDCAKQNVYYMGEHTSVFDVEDWPVCRDECKKMGDNCVGFSYYTEDYYIHDHRKRCDLFSTIHEKTPEITKQNVVSGSKNVDDYCKG